MVNIKDTKQLGKLIRSERKKQKITLVELSGLCNVGVRFLSELENGKKTVQFAKVMHILHSLGLEINIVKRTFDTWQD